MSQTDWPRQLMVAGCGPVAYGLVSPRVPYRYSMTAQSHIESTGDSPFRRQPEQLCMFALAVDRRSSA